LFFIPCPKTLYTYMPATSFLPSMKQEAINEISEKTDLTID